MGQACLPGPRPHVLVLPKVLESIENEMGILGFRVPGEKTPNLCSRFFLWPLNYRKRFELKFLPEKPVLRLRVLPTPGSRKLARALASHWTLEKGVRNSDGLVAGTAYRDSLPFPRHQMTPSFLCFRDRGFTGSFSVNDGGNQS